MSDDRFVSKAGEFSLILPGVAGGPVRKNSGVDRKVDQEPLKMEKKDR